ncbi:hypothetical protein HID58_015013 [Brassica napus]|uniref:ABC transmembrane type-1 domain-containing protein n=1 Tax=Brassica napus TaxID=3708 RepID=A0ABQ8DLB4_BRANA|nr:hypothetical protein HID58_015013 [Brassica napus]
MKGLSFLCFGHSLLICESWFHQSVRILMRSYHIQWLLKLSKIPELTEVPSFSKEAEAYLQAIIDGFNVDAALEVKKIEKVTNHDVKAVEGGFLDVTVERQAARIRSMYLKTILRQDIGFFNVETNTGEVVGRMSGDTVLLQDAPWVGKFIQLVSTFVGGFALAFVKGWLRSSSRIIYYVQKVRISHPEFAKVLEFSISLAPLRTSTTSPTRWLLGCHGRETSTVERQAARIRSMYLKTILRQDIGFFNVETNTGEVVGRMSGDTVLLQDAMGEKVGKFIQLVSTFVGGFALAFVKGWLRGGFLDVTVERQAARIRSMYLKTILRQDIGFFNVETNTGEVVGRMSGDTVLLQDAPWVGKFIQLVSTFVGGFALAFVKGWLRSSSRIIYYVQKTKLPTRFTTVIQIEENDPDDASYHIPSPPIQTVDRHSHWYQQLTRATTEVKNGLLAQFRDLHSMTIMKNKVVIITSINPRVFKGNLILATTPATRF